MVNANAQLILNTTQESMSKIKSTSLWFSIQRILRYMMLGRVGITFMIIGWTVLVSVMILWNPADNVDKPFDVKDANYIKYFNLHRLWFGEESVLLLLMNIWKYTLLLLLLKPVFTEIYKVVINKTI
jgi:hypothetical protein